MVEQRSPKPRAEGSNPSTPARKNRVPSGVRGFFVLPLSPPLPFSAAGPGKAGSFSGEGLVAFVAVGLVHVGRGGAVRQRGAEGMDKGELPDQEDHPDGQHADEVFGGGAVAHDHRPGDGVEQHFQRAAGAVFGQHLDELNADDQVEGVAQEGLEGLGAVLGDQREHLVGNGDGADQQPDEHQNGQHHLQQTGEGRHLIAQDLGDPAFLGAQAQAVQGGDEVVLAHGSSFRWRVGACH